MTQSILSFDASDTLIRANGPGLVTTAICIAMGELGAERRSSYLDCAIKHFVLKRGEIDEAVARFSDEIGLSDGKAILRAYRPPNFIVDSRTDELLQFGKQQGLRMIIVSNTTCWDCADYDHLGITELVSNLFFSCDLGFAKPSGEVFRLVEQEMDAKPDRILHVGNDQVMDFEAALSAGWKAILSKKMVNGRMVDKTAHDLIEEIRVQVSDE